jgi:malate dehydrogenase
LFLFFFFFFKKKKLKVAAALPVLQGVIMELDDGAYPLLHGVVATADYAEGFSNVDYAILVGAMPRKEGMERSDLLKVASLVFHVGFGSLLNSNVQRQML